MCNWIYTVMACSRRHHANEQPAIFPTWRKKQCNTAEMFGEGYECDDASTTNDLPTDVREIEKTDHICGGCYDALKRALEDLKAVVADAQQNCDDGR
ncbi:hypothetical protein BPOR_0294g00090 [Botrytis porri]|uniref:Uncharacterized protein n=1 Tax=Botrytis porri TaxID=87229 RepID=A0A4Z1KMH6_9HELO|nr:hypothetical protein BPOR_0294g00090 [Botrytis porri]